MFFFLSFMLVFPVWMRGGTRLEWMGPVPWLALAALGAMVLQPAPRKEETFQAARMRVLHDLFSDPILYLGAAFLLLAGLQWWNGPRAEIYDPALNQWVFGPPPRPGLSLFCVDRREALEMLFWFAPAFAALLVIRNGLPRVQKLDLLKLLAVNAGLVAFFGLIQYISGTDRIYWMTPQKVHFFAAFGYPNHAGAFFVLMAVLASGFLIRSLVRREQAAELPWLLPVLSLLLLGAILSKSRAAIILTAGLAVAGTVYGFKRVRWSQSIQGRAAALVCLAAVLGVAAYVAFVVPGNMVREEMKGTTVESVMARVEAAGNPHRAAAWRMVRDYPWFGVGGWGYRRFLPHYAPLKPPEIYGAGSANVHNDPLQFLVEFGVFGAGLLLGIVLLTVWPAVRKCRELLKPEEWDDRPWLMKMPPLGLALLTGAAVTLMHSFVDLPFRSPALLWTWFAMLACAGDCLDRGAERSRPHHHGERRRNAAPESGPAGTGKE